MTKKEKSKADIWISEREEIIHKTLDFMFSRHFTHPLSSSSTHCPLSQWRFLFYDTLSHTLLCAHPRLTLFYSLAAYPHQLPHLSFSQSTPNFLPCYYQGPTYLCSFTSVGLRLHILVKNLLPTYNSSSFGAFSGLGPQIFQSI